MRTSVLTECLLIFFLQNCLKATVLGECNIATQRLHIPEGGTFHSPGFPTTDYPPDQNCGYYLRSPSHDHGVIVKFDFFHTEGLYREEKVDFVRLTEGRITEDPVEYFYYGQLEPFTFVSTFRKVRFHFISDNFVQLPGFNGSYEYFDNQKFCKISELGDRVITCYNEKYGLATDCDIKCREIYRGRAVCTNGIFVEQECGLLINSAVQKCEATELEDCPYTIQEITDYYTNNRLIDESDLTDDNILLESLEINALPDVPPESGRGVLPCHWKYCRRINIFGGRRYSFRCGRARSNRQRHLCFRCRYETHCQTGIADVFN